MTIANMPIASNGGASPLELRLDWAKRQQTRSLVRIFLSGAALLKWVWWYAKSYLPIVGILLLALGSLVVLQGHWLYRRLAPLSLRHKAVLKNAG